MHFAVPGEGDACQRTAGESTIADAGHAFRDGNGRKTAAIAKRTISDVEDAVRDRDSGQANTTIEGIGTEDLQPFRKGDRGQA